MVWVRGRVPQGRCGRKGKRWLEVSSDVGRTLEHLSIHQPQSALCPTVYANSSLMLWRAPPAPFLLRLIKPSPQRSTIVTTSSQEHTMTRSTGRPQRLTAMTFQFDLCVRFACRSHTRGSKTSRRHTASPSKSLRGALFGPTVLGDTVADPV